MLRLHKNNVLAGTALAVLVFSPVGLFATDYTWNVASGFWDTASNWSPNGTPGAGDSIEFNFSAQTALSVGGGEKFVDTILKTQAGALLRVDIKGDGVGGSILNANLITNSTSGTFAFSNGTSLANGLVVNATNVTIGGTGSTFFGVTTASGAGNLLNGLTVSGVTTLTGGNLLINTNSDFSLGLVNISAGVLSLNNANGAKSVSPIASVSGLSGGGGVIQGAVNAGSVITNVVTLAISNSSAHSSAALIRDSASGAAGADGILNVSKAGVGVQTLTGANTYTGTTQVGGGTLYINGTHTGGGAYTIEAGATLGGSGQIGASGMSFADGGNLDVGGPGVGNLTLSLAAAGLDLSGISTAGSLLFELDTIGASDRVTLSAGTLNVGTLDFSEFSFTDLGGLGVGDYILFDASTSVSGTIGQSSGLLGGFLGTLSIDSINHDVVLTVSAIPEPSTYAVMAAGAALAGATILRRRRSAV